MTVNWYAQKLLTCFPSSNHSCSDTLGLLVLLPTSGSAIILAAARGRYSLCTWSLLTMHMVATVHAHYNVQYGRILHSCSMEHLYYAHINIVTSIICVVSDFKSINHFTIHTSWNGSVHHIFPITLHPPLPSIMHPTGLPSWTTSASKACSICPAHLYHYCVHYLKTSVNFFQMKDLKHKIKQQKKWNMLICRTCSVYI